MKLSTSQRKLYWLSAVLLALTLVIVGRVGAVGRARQSGQRAARRAGIPGGRRYGAALAVRRAGRHPAAPGRAGHPSYRGLLSG